MINILIQKKSTKLHKLRNKSNNRELYKMSSTLARNVPYNYYIQILSNLQSYLSPKRNYYSQLPHIYFEFFSSIRGTKLLKEIDQF